MVSCLTGSLCMVFRMRLLLSALLNRSTAPLKNRGKENSISLTKLSKSSVKPTKKYLLAKLNLACSSAHLLPGGSQHLLKCPQNHGTCCHSFLGSQSGRPSATHSSKVCLSPIRLRILPFR